jgi:two-component system, cell cycle sensor histidine kinase and response regulator CckA
MPSPDFERFFELSPDLCCLASSDGSLVRINPAVCSRLGLSPDQLTNRHFSALIHPEDAAVVRQQLALLADGGPPRQFESRCQGTGGGDRLVRWTMVLDSTSGFIFASGVDLAGLDDVGQPSQIQLQRFQSLIEHSADIIVLLGLDGSLQYLSPAFESVLGHRVAEWLGQMVFSLVWPDDVDEALQLVKRSLESPGVPIPWQVRIRHADGTCRWLEGTGINATEGPGAGGIVINCRDITERQRTEEALRASSDLLSRLAQQVPGVIYQFRLHPDGRSSFPFASEAIRDIYEVTPDEVREDASVVFTRLHPEDAERVASSIAQSAETLEPWRCEYRVTLPRQGVRWRSGHARPQRQADGGILWHGFITDVTDRKHAEEELLRKEAAIASSMNGIAMADFAGNLTYVNRAFLDLWGFEESSAVLGRSAVSMWDTPGSAEAAIAQIRDRGTWSGELVAHRTDGTMRTLQVNASLFTDTAGKPAGMLASFLDITESKQLQVQLLQAQKMESVGRLAGGVAHDFNNLLTVIKGYLELAIVGLEEGDPRRADLLQAEKAADSAASLTGQLLAFSRKQLIDPKVLSLNDIVLRVEAMLHRILGEDIEFRTVTAPDLGRVRFDPGQAEQILLNLAINARDAMPNGGSLRLETANVRIEPQSLREHPGMTPGEYVLLSVTDTGSGMSEEVKANLFEPFFTTKAPGSGTGLGLAMIYGAVSQNGGTIEVDSKLGQGATFRIYLPRVEGAPAVEPAPAMPHAAMGRETILLVEDEESVRSLATRLLRRQGYRVHAFSSASSAIEAVRGMTEPLHLLLTDVVMPELNGRRLSEEIRALRPGIRVLYTSGYTADVMLQHGVLKERVEFLAKPYSIGVLARRVREVLDKPGA